MSFILYASDLEQNNVRLGMLKTKDFLSFERVCTASELGNRNGALFPEKYDDLYFRLDRPFGNELLPYHKMGEHKYEALGLKVTAYTAPTDRKIEEFKAMRKKRIGSNKYDFEFFRKRNRSELCSYR